VKILELAKELIEKRGLTVGKDIEISFTGLRPGEKLFEELSCDNEQIAPTSHRKIHVWRLPNPGQQQVDRMLKLLAGVIHDSRAQVQFALAQCVVEYTPDLPQSAAEPVDQATNLRILAQRAA
jgi:FlaA1/EpsC-like NDP-sugar epimerase